MSDARYATLRRALTAHGPAQFVFVLNHIPDQEDIFHILIDTNTIVMTEIDRRSGEVGPTTFLSVDEYRSKHFRNMMKRNKARFQQALALSRELLMPRHS